MPYILPVTGYKSAGFLASLSYDVEGSAVTNILFNKVEYDYGNNYNPATGVYTVPRDGLYLIHARVYGRDNYASHYIRVNGNIVTSAAEHDPGHLYQSASTSIVLHLLSGHEVAVDPSFTGSVDGWTNYMTTSFGAMLLYAD